jgi:uncharacterized phage protein gp47/JayE
MASVTWQGLTGFVQTQIAALQSAAEAVIDATTGSLTLAWAQAVTGVALWLQAQVAQAIALTRFQTSYGSDADSWGQQFGFKRLGAVAATGLATFSRYQTTQQAVILAGTLQNGVLTGGATISTGPGGVQFMVTEDATNPLWNASLGGYVLPIGTASGTVPIQCLTPGTSGNVLANTIQSFISPIPYIDTVTNGSALANGVAAEMDSAYKARFPLFLAGLAGATEAAIESAIVSTQQGIFYDLLENEQPNGTTQLGAFTAVIDDGSGAPPASLITSIANAVDVARGFTIQPYIVAVTKIVPSIALNIRVASGYTTTSVNAAVQAAIVAYVNSLEPGDGYLYVNQVESTALKVPGVAGVQPGATLFNGVNADLALTPFQVPRIAVANVTVGSY